MSDSISTVGIRVSCTNLLLGGQTQLSKLSAQLATGRYSDNMTDYTSSNAQKLLNFNSEVNMQGGFIEVISAITPRMEVYELAFEGMEETIGETYTLLNGSSVYTEATNLSVRNEIINALDQMEYYLNMQVGERYIFSGTRYNEAPVTNLNALPALTTLSTPTIATGDQVAEYDIDYDPLLPLADVPAANVHETTKIDETKDLRYGVNSNDESFQRAILGLRYALAATYDPDNYDSLMSTSKSYLSESVKGIRALHTNSTNAYTTLKKAEETIKNKITSLENQVDDIESVDINEIAVKLQVYQAQLQASYSAVSQIIHLSILDHI